MLMLFANGIKFVCNLVALYMYNFYESVTSEQHTQKSVVLFDNVHTTETHIIVDFTFNGKTSSIIIENPKFETRECDILSVYDQDHGRDLTSKFKRFSHHYDGESKSFQYLEIIKQFFNTSDNIVLVNHELVEHQLGKNGGPSVV